MTKRAATFVGEIDLICYGFDLCRSVLGDFGNVIVVCEYDESVVDVL